MEHTLQHYEILRGNGDGTAVLKRMLSITNLFIWHDICDISMFFYKYLEAILPY